MAKRIRLYCINTKCKNYTVVKAPSKAHEAYGHYYNKKYGEFDIRNIGFVCDDCQKSYDKYYRKNGWHKIYGVLGKNRGII